MFAPLLDVEASFCVAGARDCAPCQTCARREGFVAFPKTMAGVGHLKRICKDAFSVAGAVFIRAVARSGRWFPERGCILEPPIFRFTEMILRDKCHTSCDPASLFRGRRSSLDRWTKKTQNALARGRQLCTQLSIFERCLAELLRFWCCQLKKMRKSRRLVSFLTLSSSKIEEVSQNCFVFDVVKFNNSGSLAEELHFQACR